MAIFRKIYPRCWHSLIGLSPLEKLIAIYILSGPQTNRCGIYFFSIGRAIEDLETLPQTFRGGFQNVLKHLDWEYDKHSRVVYIPTWWKWNKPENPNVLISNLRDIDEIPKTSLISKFYANTIYLPDNLIETFTQTLPQTLPQTIAESEAVEEAVEEEKYSCASEMHETIKNPSKENGFDQFWTSYPKKKSKGAAEKAFNSAKKQPEFNLIAVMQALEQQKQSEDWIKDSGQFIPFPATWLNQKRWLDEIKTNTNQWAEMEAWANGKTNTR